MPGRRIFWQLYGSYLAAILLVMVAVVAYASDSVKRFYHKRVEADLESRAILVGGQLAPLLGSPGEMDALCKTLGKRSRTRITVIAPDGQVLAESDHDTAAMENHKTDDRKEILSALEGRVGISTRYSDTRERSMKYVAVPLLGKGPGGRQVRGVVRTSVSVAFIDAGLRSAYWQIALGCLAAAGLFALLSLAISKRISQPLEELREGAAAFARGDLARRLPGNHLEEIGELADAMNQMAEQLDERIRNTTRERNEREAILAGMIEGVLAVDRKGKVMGVNQACSRLLGIEDIEARGKSLQEVVRNPDLQDFVSQVLSSASPTEGDVILRGGSGDLVLQARGAVLRDALGQEIGAVVVLHDVTRLRRLENVRRDFVANVSHELRTPITSIKAAVETLEDGALGSEQEARRFMTMISRQSDRLGAIIEDLLSLSRIEQDESAEGIALTASNLDPVLRAAVQACGAKANEKGVSIQLNSPDGLRARANPALLENAVINLIDNAIKYSGKGDTVWVGAESEGGEILIHVVDRGCGIERRHLPRIFERFYRVDKARSRKLGGTGLGLSIVKHIAGAHGGRVTVDSKLGEGSTFTLHLPS